MKYSKFLKFVFILCFIIVSSIYSSTKKYWEKVEEATHNGLPRTAIKSLDKIIEISQKKKDYNEWLKALIYKIVLEASIQGNKPEEKVKRLKGELKKADLHTKPMLQTILAQWYWQYYQRNKYRFAKRSPTESMDEDDFTTWDLRKLFNEIDSLYQDILKEKYLLIKLSTEEFLDFLEPGDTPIELRPTLYDLIAHEAINFYTRGEYCAIHPEDAFEIDANSTAFSPINEFLSYEPLTEDTSSSKLKIIKLYQSLLKHHQEKKNTEALVDLELHRLQYIKNNSFGEDINGIYIQRLTELIKKYKTSPTSSLATYYLAKAWSEEDELRKAYEVAKNGYEIFPNSKGGNFCLAFMIQLSSKSLKLKCDKYIYPGTSTILSHYKNFTTLYFRIYKDKWDGFIKGTRKYFNRLTKEEIEELLTQKPIDEWQVELPETKDLKEKYFEIDIPALEQGHYWIFASWEPDFITSSMATYTCLTVSNLTLVSREQLGTFNGLVLDAKTGEPLKDAMVSRIIYIDEKYIYVDTTYTNSDGLFEYKIHRLKKFHNYRQNHFIHIKKDEDELLIKKTIRGRSDHPSKPKTRTFFFTDRSIYRPGQSIYFKGICVHIDTDGNNYKILPKQSVTVQFRDANDKEIATETFTTNEFGSFSGHFTAPIDRLTGIMTIRAKNPNGSTSIRVEEYKRPKFTVEIEKPEKAFRVNQDIVVIGKATTYTNAPVNSASVRYSVERTTRYPYWWGWYYYWGRQFRGKQQIAHGKTKTNDDGTFEIPFSAKPDLRISPDEEPRFVYSILADVTSPDGETRSASSFIILGYTALQLKLSTNDFLQNNKKFHIQVSSQTLDGKNIPADATLKIFRLKEPLEPIRNPFGKDKYLYNSKMNTDKEIFTSDWITWPREKPVREIKITTKKSNPESIAIKLPTGLYHIECLSKDKYGKDVKALLPVMVLPGWKERRFNIKLPSISRTNNNTVEVGNVLKILWGTGYDKGRCFVEIEYDKRIIKRYWTDKFVTQHTFDFPVQEKHRGGFTIHLTHVKDNRAYTHNFSINVPWDNKVLTIQLESFRDKIQPGEKETIKVKIMGKKHLLKTEMVATMYDYSLDQFDAHSWRTFNFFSRNYYLRSRSFINRAQGFRGIRYTWNEEVKYPSQNTYLHFSNYIIRDFLFYRFPVIKLPVTGGGGGVLYKEQKDSDGKTSKISGQVIDASTGEPLPFSNILILGTTIGTVTDRNGNFVITNITPGRYNVQARMMGYNAATVSNVLVKIGQTAVINFDLPPEVIMVEGISVYCKRTIEPDMTSTRAEITASIIEPTNGGIKLGIDVEGIKIRRILNETAFFYPHLYAGKDGTVKFEFKCPETLTKWKFLGFAHGKECESGTITEYAVSSKELMVQPNPPRFLREGDTLYFTAKVVNVSDKFQKGRVQLSFKDLITEKPMDKFLGLSSNVQAFKIDAHTSEAFSWKITVPKGMNPLSYTVVAKSKKHSDGEAGAIPVLSSRIFLTESFPLYVRGPQTKRFTFDRLKEMDKSKTLEPYKFTLQMASNPSWYVIQALPYLIEFPYECSEQIFNRFYANSLAKYIANSNPRIREIFNQWRETDALKSNLEKNEDLKSVLLAETPWVIQAQNESQAKRNVGILFEENTLNNNLNSAFTKLKNMQLSDGSWSWFPGGKPNPYISLYIMTGFGRLRHLGVKTDISLAMNSINYVDSIINVNYKHITDKSINHLSHFIAFYLYGRSFFLKEKPISPAHKKAVNYFLGQAEQYWLKLNSRLSQGYLALALNRFGRNETAKKIMASIKERSVQNEEMGMFWRETERSWWWYRAPIETQALMIEAFLEVMNDTVAAEECKVWLLKQKQTQDWKTTKATADAVYALILRGVEYLSSTKLVRVKLGETEVTPEKIEAGTGFYEKMYLKKEIKPQFSNISVIKEDKGIAWGGAYFQYFEEMSAVTSHTTNLQLDKKLFVNRETKKGRIIEPVTGSLNVGDLVTVRVVLRVDRDMEYVHLKDLRGSGLEPVDVLSRYRYQDGLRYYQSTKDVATHFFIDYLPKGTYVFEYDLRVQHKGQYQSGIAEIQCMYAPEFSSHSQSQWLEVR